VKATTAEHRAAVQEARQGAQEARRALMMGEGDADAVLAAEDVLIGSKRRLRYASMEEEIVRERLAEAVLARWGADAVGAAIGLPLSVSVSPSAGEGLRDALFSD
jgi:hypothetical protein